MKKANSKLLVVGRNGFLGSTLVNEIQADSVDRTQIDLARLNSSSVDGVLSLGYSHVAICAAATDIEFCFRNPNNSFQINVLGTIELLKKIKEVGSTPIFFSTDYVFKPKETPHKEEDEKKPVTLYGQQKLQTEQFIQQNFDQFLIFRTSKLVSKTRHPKNILNPIIENLKLQKTIRLFEDQYLNPVFTEDIAAVVEKSMKTQLSGVFHLGTRKVYTRADLGRAVASHFNFDSRLIKPGYLKDAVTSEPRPHHNTLSCKKTEEALDFKFTEIAQGLEDFKDPQD
jgi:dTDP-4-dehydrorhamnose reductase